MDLTNEDRLAKVLTASELLVGARSVEEVVAVLRDTARAAIGAEGVAVVIEDGGYCSYVAEDSVSPLWQGQSFPADHCISGWVMRHDQTVAIPDVHKDPRIPQDAYAPTFVKSMVMVPIGSPNPVAALGTYWSDVHEHDLDTINRLESLARLATIAIENARLTQARNRATALGAAQNRVLELAVGETPLEVTLDEMVHEVEGLSISGFLASIILLTEDGQQVEHCSVPSLPYAYRDAIVGITVSHIGKSSDFKTVQAVPTFDKSDAAAYSSLTLDHDLNVCWSTPMRSAKGLTLGVLVMCHRDMREPLSADLEIVDFVTRTLEILMTTRSNKLLVYWMDGLPSYLGIYSLMRLRTARAFGTRVRRSINTLG